MENTTTVSVIIPTLNEERYIEACLNSIFLQTYPAHLIEIFIIDGGSTDKTVSIVNELIPKHPNISILINPKRIQAAAFNIGVKKSKNEIIFRFDGHCTYDTRYIYYCVLNFLEVQYGNVGGCWIVKPGANTLMGKSIAYINSSLFGLGGATYRIGTEKKLVDSVPFGAFPKQVLKSIGEMNEELNRGEDNEFNLRIRKAGYKILFDPNIISYYYARPTFYSFMKQMHDNGISIGILIRKDISTINLRHFIPLAFVLFLIVGGVLSFVNISIFICFCCILILYFILDLISSLLAMHKDIRILLLIFCTTFFSHIIYGLGTIVGLYKGQYKN